MAGWFADDLGPRSCSRTLTASRTKPAYRAGAIAPAQTLRKVANKHGLIFDRQRHLVGEAVEAISISPRAETVCMAAFDHRRHRSAYRSDR